MNVNPSLEKVIVSEYLYYSECIIKRGHVSQKYVGCFGWESFQFGCRFVLNISAALNKDIKRCFWETKPYTLCEASALSSSIRTQYFVEVWLYTQPVQCCPVVRSEIQSVSFQPFRCEIQEVRSLHFLKGISSLLHNFGDEAGHAAVSAIKKKYYGFFIV